MEEQNTQKQLMPQDLFAHQAVPPSLLSGVFGRIEALDEYTEGRVAQETLIGSLSDARWETRAAVAYALGEAGGIAAVQPLLTALQDEHMQVRAAAVRALGRLGTLVPVERLIPVLRDPAWEVREMAVLALGELDGSVSAALLATMLEDTHGEVRDAAHYALSLQNTREPEYNALSVRACAEEPASYAVSARDAGEAYRAQSSLAPVEAEGARRELSLGAKLWNGIIHSWLVFKGQVPIVRRSWAATLLILFLSYSLVLVALLHMDSSGRVAAQVLALLICVSVVAGAAFIATREQDGALELTLATPTSMRLIMLCRFALVVGFALLLALGASLGVSQLFGVNFWEIVRLWLGPLFLLASLTLSASLWLGSGLAFLAGLLVELVQTIAVKFGANAPLLSLSFSRNWQTNPVVFGLALFFLLLVLLYAPRQRISML